ncbi:MAG: class I SAM-dependent methyltransferase [Acidimicrobiales bacterium]
MTAQVANTEQAREWNTTEGEHWVAHQERYDRMLGAFGDRLLEAAAIQPTDAVMDVGCGCGATTRAAARQAGEGEALGVDLSAPMLTLARQLAADEALANVRFEQADAQVHRFDPARYSAAISRFGVMFFADPVAAFANIAAALEPDGRLVFTCWRAALDNEWIMVPAAAALQYVPLPDLGDESQPGPFSLARPERVRQVLEGAGHTVESVDSLDVPLRLGADATTPSSSSEEPGWPRGCSRRSHQSSRTVRWPPCGTHWSGSSRRTALCWVRPLGSSPPADREDLRQVIAEW